MIEITVKQQETINFIRKFKQKNGIAPTYREIAKNFNISVRAACDRISQLHKKHVLKSIPGKARSISFYSERI